MKAEISELNINIIDLKKEINETKIVINDSLRLTSNTLKEIMSEFSKTVEKFIEQMIEMNKKLSIKDNILQNIKRILQID